MQHAFAVRVQKTRNCPKENVYSIQSFDSPYRLKWRSSGGFQDVESKERSAFLPLSIQMMLFGWSNNLSHLALSNGW